MLHDIFPKKFHIEYYDKSPSDNSNIIIFNERTVLISNDEQQYFPLYKDIKDYCKKVIYLFSIDEESYYLMLCDEMLSIEGYTYKNVSILREMKPKHSAFALSTAFHLFCWYNDNKFCGRCGQILYPDNKERMLFCNSCGNVVFPKIAPAIIVAITDNNRILLTRYSDREYKKYALVAGFVEAGESAEDTVRREVFEEVGLRVKNITYYKSQPWGLSGTFLVGMFAELDGRDEVTLDENELSEALWVEREDIDVEYNDTSLTNEMICAFKDKKRGIAQ